MVGKGCKLNRIQGIMGILNMATINDNDKTMAFSSSEIPLPWPATLSYEFIVP